MPDLRSRAEKLRAMASQTASPREAEIAKAKLAAMPTPPSDLPPRYYSWTLADSRRRAQEFAASVEAIKDTQRQWQAEQAQRKRAAWSARLDERAAHDAARSSWRTTARTEGAIRADAKLRRDLDVDPDCTCPEGWVNRSTRHHRQCQMVRDWIAGADGP